MSTSSTKRRGYRYVRDSLLARIQRGDLPVNSRVPSLAEIGRELGVSYLTAQRGYRVLAGEGVLRMAPGKRAVVVRSSLESKRRTRVVGGLFREFRQREHRDNYALDMYEAICRETVEQHISMRHRKGCADGACEALLTDIHAGEIEAVIIDETISNDVIAKVAQTGVPAVLLNRDGSGINIDSVCPDHVWMGRQTARAVLDKGYGQVVLCWIPPADYSVPEGAVKPEANQFFLYAVRDDLLDHGFPGEQVTVLSQTANDINSWLSPADLLPLVRGSNSVQSIRTAFVCSNDWFALRIAAILRDLGIQVPQECGVIGRYNYDVNREAAHPVTTWKIDPAEVGRETVKVLLERIEFPDRGRIHRFLCPGLVDHGTF